MSNQPTDTEVIGLIPAYEPDRNLVQVARDLHLRGVRVFVVDDGSTDAYADIFRQTAQYADITSYPVNKGKGNALKTGMEKIAEYVKTVTHPCTVVTLDADGQHIATDVMNTAMDAAAHPGTLVLGERTFGKDTPARSRFGNAMTVLAYRLASGVRLRDTQTGLRAFSADLLPVMIGIEGNRYEYEMNVLLACPKYKIPIRSVSISTIYIDGNSGSHFHPFRDSYLIYRHFITFIAVSISSFLLDYGLYLFFVRFCAVNIGMSTLIARIISSGFNFCMNRHVVFRNRDNILKKAAEYFLLAACILGCNILCMHLLIDIWGWNKFWAKLPVEILLFFTNFTIQKMIIFRKKRKNKGKPGDRQ